MIIVITVLALVVAICTIIKGRKILKGEVVVEGTKILSSDDLIKFSKKDRLIKHLIRSVALFSVLLITFIVIGTVEVIMASPVTQEVGETATKVASVGLTLGDGLKYLAAALSTGLATIGTGVAVGSTGSAAIGAVSEDASNVGKTLIFVGMGEGIAIYGMIISILILFV